MDNDPLIRPPPAIDLAHVADFCIGDLVVRPSRREVVGAGGREFVQPRVMQVLVALARAQGDVVSRDDLIASCWGGRVVGEDAITRAIGHIRRLGEGVAARAFALETVPRVGYRLVARESAARESCATSPPWTAMDNAPVAAPLVAESAPAPLPRRSRRARTLPLALAGIAALGSALALRQAADPRPVPARAALVASQQPPPLDAARDLETRGLAAVFEGTPEQTSQGLAYLREGMAMRRDYAAGWGSLAMAYVLSLPHTPAAARAEVAMRVREAAARGLALNPRDGHSLAALTSLEPTFGAWDVKDRAQRRALALAGADWPALMNQRVQFLMQVGRTREALVESERLQAISPLIPWIQANRIMLLAANHRPDEAERAAAYAGHIWPRNRQIWFTRFWFDALRGRPERALAMIADRPGWPTQTDPAEIALCGRAAAAIASRAPADADAILATYRGLALRAQSHAETAILVAAALGRREDALAFARTLYTRPVPAGPRGWLTPAIGYERAGERITAPLFAPPADRLWADPAFFRLTSDIGLVAWWRSTGPPDLCRDPAAAPLCAANGITPPA